MQGATCEPSSSFRCTLTFSHPDNAAEVEAVVGPAKQPPAKRQKGRDSSILPDKGGGRGLLTGCNKGTAHHSDLSFAELRPSARPTG